MGKGEIARSEQFLLFLQCFIPIWRTFRNSYQNLKLSSAKPFSLEESKIRRFGKGLKACTPLYLLLAGRFLDLSTVLIFKAFTSKYVAQIIEITLNDTEKKCPLNPFPNKPWFLRDCCTCLLKTLRDKEFLLFPQSSLPF